MSRIPVTVVSGFLGSGKTTLINRVLKEEHGLSIAVIVNDVGDLDVDAALIREQGDEVISLRNGCVCCSMQGDLIAQIARLVVKQKLDHIIIEASGVSEPGNIVRGLGYPQLRSKVYVSTVLTLIDAELFPRLRGSARYLVGEQLAAADVVLLNKADRVSPQELQAVAEGCACPDLPIIECSYADIRVDVFFSAHHEGSSRNEQARRDATDAFFESRIWRPTGPVNLDTLRLVFASMPNEVIRVKGFLQAEGTGDTWLIQMVGRRTNFTRTINGNASALVLIGMRGENEWLSIFKGLDSSVAADSMAGHEYARSAN